jgi:hypothetical protein
MCPSITALMAAVEAHARQLLQQADLEIYEPAADVLKAEAARWQGMAAQARAELTRAGNVS